MTEPEFDEDSTWDDEPADWCRECEEPIDAEEDNGSGLCPYCRNE